MRIIDRYILTSIMAIFAGCVLTFSCLFILIDLFSNLQNFIEKSVPLAMMAQYYISFIPTIVVQTSSMACLIAVLFTYSHLVAHNEIIAIRTSGMNFWQTTRPALVFSLFTCALVFLVNEKFVPQSWMMNQEIRDTQIKIATGQKSKAKPLINNLTFYGLKNRLFFINVYDPNTSEPRGIVIIGHDRKQNMVEKITALKGRWTGVAWKFFNVQITTYESKLPNVPGPIKVYPEKLMDIRETPKDFLKQRMDVSSMNLQELHRYIKRFAGSGAIRTVNNFRTDFHQKITLCVRSFVIVLLGLPFVLKTGAKRRGFTFASIAMAIIIGFLYYVADAVGLALAKGGALLPWEGAWLTPVVFSAVAFYIIGKEF